MTKTNSFALLFALSISLPCFAGEPLLVIEGTLKIVDALQRIDNELRINASSCTATAKFDQTMRIGTQAGLKVNRIEILRHTQFTKIAAIPPLSWIEAHQATEDIDLILGDNEYPEIRRIYLRNCRFPISNQGFIYDESITNN